MSVAIFKGKLVKFLAKAGILIPKRPTTDRSGTPEQGETAFNTTDNKLEVWDGTTWVQVSAGGGGSGTGLSHPTTNSTFESGTNNVSMTGQNNTSIGVSAGISLTTGAENTLFGSNAGSLLTSGINNIAIGSYAGARLTTGYDNVAVGRSAMRGPTVTTTSNNVAIGRAAGYSITGDGNVLIGSGADCTSTGGFTTYNNIAIGKDSGVKLTLPDIIESVAIGSSTTVQYSYGYVLGKSSHSYRVPGIFNTPIVIGPGRNVDGTYNGQTGILKFSELNGNGTNTVGFKAPDSIAADVTWTLPATDGTSGQVLSTNGTGTLSWATAGGSSYILPQLNAIQNLTNWQNRLTPLHTKNANALTYVSSIPLSTTLSTFAHAGAVYSPIQDRIYFVPYAVGANQFWYYLECETSTIVQYTALAAGLISGAYFGGVYSPTQNRIYLIPYAVSTQTSWHYINCSVGTNSGTNVHVFPYTHGATVVANAYMGGVYSPTQNRIYFAPAGQANQTNWHYVDCSTGNIVAYAHGLTVSPVANAYRGAVYSPTQNRIYFVPNAQASETKWHYIDCSTGNVVEYTHGVTAVTGAYYGGVYSPIQNRIYFVPYGQSSQTNWHYVDCSTGNIVQYAKVVTSVTSLAYSGGVYHPLLNRIYLVPYDQGSIATWHYIDCVTGNIVEYSGNTAQVGAYVGGAYSPKENKIYFASHRQTSNIASYIGSSSNPDMIPHEFGSTIISSTL